jgi:hypothetical protein
MVQRAAASGPADSINATVIVRPGPVPGVAVIGDFDDAAAARVRQLFVDLEECLTQWLHVDFPRAERDCEVLAEQLERRLGTSGLDSASYQAIPRGGLIVLGMLSIVMGLRHGQLEHSSDSDLVVVVDDCAYTGYRLRRALADVTAHRVACALLRAPAELCASVELSEPRVSACLAAGTLRDLGPERIGEGYVDWIRAWSQRAKGDERYWIGRPELVSFAWKEPDRSFVNEVTGLREDGWRVMPTEVCLTARSLRPALTVVQQPNGCGPCRPSDQVFWTEMDGEVVVVKPSAEHVLRLDTVAGVFWRAIVERGSVDGMVEVARQTFDVDEEQLRSDATAFVADLLRSGLLADQR